MALTVAKISGVSTDFVEGNKKVRVRTVTFDSSYATGGEALTASDFGLRVLTEVRPHGAFRTTDATSAVTVSYDHTNAKLVAYWGNAGSASVLPEVTSTTDLSTYSGRVTAVGY